MAMNFDSAFENDEPVPDNLRAFSEVFCGQFGISGVCDPMYVANVAAFELRLGNGRGMFWLSGQPATKKHVDGLAARLMHAYSTCISQSEADVTQSDIVQMIQQKALGSTVEEALCH